MKPITMFPTVVGIVEELHSPEIDFNKVKWDVVRKGSTNESEVSLDFNVLSLYQDWEIRIKFHIKEYIIDIVWHYIVSSLFQGTSSLLASSNDNANFYSFFNWHDLWMAFVFFYSFGLLS